MRVRLVARLNAGPITHSGYLVGSFAAHVLLLVLMLVLPSLRGGPRIPDSPLVVDLVSVAAPSAPAVQTAPAPRAAPPEPPPRTPPEGVSVTPEPPQQEIELPEPESLPPEPKKAPEPKPKPPKPRRKTPTAPADKTPALPENTPPPGGPPGEGSGAEITALEGAGDFELGWYRASVTSSLYGYWKQPILEGLSEPRQVRVTFEILRDGSIRGLRVEGSSGVPSLDRSALRAVGEAAPFPPLPPNWKKPTLSAGFVFRLYPE